MVDVESSVERGVTTISKLCLKIGKQKVLVELREYLRLLRRCVQEVLSYASGEKSTS